MVEIDAKTATVVRRWPAAPCKQPVAMAIDTAHHRLFSGCRSGMMAISDYQAGKVITTVPIGSGVDGTGFDASSGDAFASNADGTLTVIHQDSPDQYHVVENIHTPQGARNMGLDSSNHRVYIVSAKFGPTPVGARRGPVLPGSFTLMVIERDSVKRAVPITIGGKADRQPGYIVMFEDNMDAPVGVARLEKVYDIKNKYIYNIRGLRGVAGNVSAELIEEMRWEPSIKSIDHDAVARKGAN